jgi:hypothetical protein
MYHTPSSTNPNSHCQSIFYEALRAYKNTTGKELPSHPLFRDLTACDSPDTICQVLQRQFSGYDQPGTSKDTSAEWLVATVDVINQALQTIAPGVSMVSRSMQVTGQGQGSDMYFIGISSWGGDLCWHRHPLLCRRLSALLPGLVTPTSFRWLRL